ncbi:MAG: 2-oxo acid dehydrogenase subunit E2 [Eubacteriales bacterium]|nr:2-oxo acid dehydrogenase subunit E2 [Eubacteriales bacterium]
MARRDAKLVGKLDPMHIIVPLLYPNRCDNEAYISERIDLSAINKYLEKKNEGLIQEEDGKVFKYTLFHVILAAILKTVTLRPKLNYFIANKRIYERNKITASFIVKKAFSDHGAEALAFLEGKPQDSIDDIHEKIRAQVYSCRSEKLDGSTESMNIISKLPFFLVRFVVWFCRKLDVHGKVPKSMIESDPYYNTVVLSNLGSIKLKSGYHHLTNWGSNSLFCIIGEKKIRPFFAADGSYEMKDSVELGLTVDERIADGYYYAKSIRLLKKLLDNPELLERPLSEEIDY